MVDVVAGTNDSLKRLLEPLLRPRPLAAKKPKSKIDSNRAKLAQAKLQALRMAAHAAAARGDAKAARRIAAEAHAIGRDLGRLAKSVGADSLEAAAEAQSIRAGVDEARSVIAAARKAARPGSRDDRDMQEMEERMDSPVDESA